jgi:hypothetical protein
MDPSNIIFPVLHIGTVNNVLDSLLVFIENQVEVRSQEEKMARNQKFFFQMLATFVQKRLSMIGILQGVPLN